ncbi:hypothetical protein HMPREF1705_04702 [Acetomicrobium hydrogeniformans ATCC BAA-1850]|uniref:Uncharacterized protein n=1 Tax=Acetomicrobium hydrogeniformans ATCC BAA-1850 TaxID=592015 RepID=A0A0T5XCL9_9BACT|nr:hypothetical protein HMPREF1705_04702 [Acetomicrobium hydrogeniformans ATCC BAA-1850]
MHINCPNDKDCILNEKQETLFKKKKRDSGEIDRACLSHVWRKIK